MELSPSQKLLLVMMRLRCNFPQNDLACRFNVEQSLVSRIVNQWIPMLKTQLKSLIRYGRKQLLAQLFTPTISCQMQWLLLMELKFLYKDQVIWLPKSHPIAITKVIPL